MSTLQAESDKNSITGRQLFIITVLYCAGDSILILPSLVTLHGRQDAWLSTVIGIILSLPLLLLYARLFRDAGSASFISLCKSELGRFIGAIAALIVWGYYMLLAATLLREVGSFLVNQILPETPIEVLIIVILIVAGTGLQQGMSTISRTSELIFPLVVCLLVIFTLLIIPEVKIDRLEPFWQRSPLQLMAGSVPVITIPFAELSVLLMLRPATLHAAKPGKIITGALIAGIGLIAIITLSTVVLGPELTARSTYPTYLMAKKVHIGNFVERVEVIMAVLWMLSIYIKLIITIYALMRGISDWFKLPSGRPLILPICLILLPATIMLSSNIIEFNYFVLHYWHFLSLLACIIVPLVVYLALRHRKSGDPSPTPSSR